MPLRHLAHRLLFCVCVAITLLGARSARAAAPICDERGASAIAPLPVLPIRDVRLDASGPLACFELDADGPGFVPGGPWQGTGADGAAIDASITTSPTQLSSGPSENASWAPIAAFALPTGHRFCVFRPPRV